jgi:hypothetical protein
MTAIVVDKSRGNQVRQYIGASVELVAGPDDLTADAGVLVGIRGGDAWDESAAIVDFKRNGRFLIPVSMLFIPEYDVVVRETNAFILLRSAPTERRAMCVSFHVTSRGVREPSREVNNAGF